MIVLLLILAHSEWLRLGNYKVIVHLSRWRHFVEVSSMWTCSFIICQTN